MWKCLIKVAFFSDFETLCLKIIKKIFYRSIWWVLMLKNSSKPTFIRENCIAKYIQCIDMEKRRPTIQMLLEIRNRCLIYRGGWKFSLLRFQPDFYIPNLTLTLYFQSCEKISKSHEFKTFLLKIRQIEGTSTLISYTINKVSRIFPYLGYFAISRSRTYLYTLYLNFHA